MKIPFKLPEPLSRLIRKYKYPLLILGLGLLLLLIPTGKSKSAADAQTVPPATEPAQQTETEQEYCDRIRSELETMLSRIRGAGKVKVMLTLREGRRTIYQTDFETTSQQRTEETNNLSRHNTVIISRGSSYDEPVVVTEDYPVFQGALILCEGADDAQVRLDLTNAVASLLHLSTDKITVLKMN